MSDRLQHGLWERRSRRDNWRQSKSLSFQDYPPGFRPIGLHLGYPAAATSSSAAERLPTLDMSRSPWAFSFMLTPKIVLQAPLFGLIMDFFGGVLPAIRAARMNLVEALREA